MDDYVQKRRHARRPVRLPARLKFGAQELEAETENISPGGAFVRVALPEDAVDLVASIALPQGRDLLVRARVRWRRQDPPGVGLEFGAFLESDADGGTPDPD